jgi:hypothetical protein
MSKQFPSKDAFDKLLRWLDSDRDRAGERHEKIRFRLIRIFACRGCGEPEDLADQSINVVCSRVDWLIENYQGDPALYFYGVAKRVFLDYLKKKRGLEVLPPPPDTLEMERRCSCLDQCMKRQLSEAERDLVLKYQEKEKREKIIVRKQLAEELGISINALRIRVCHIHARLKPCIERCLRHLPEL